MFSKYPLTIYDEKLATDILKKVQFTDGFRKSSFVENYTVQEEDTPESLAYYLYGDVRMSWIILTLNSISDRNHDWPYQYNAMNMILSSRYSGSSVFITDANIDFSFSDIVSINNYPVSSTNRSLNKITTSTPIVSIGNTATLLFKDGTTDAVPIGRVVYDDSFSVHHFEYDGEYIDPRGSDDADIEYESICDNCLLGYINGSNEIYAITNRDYEMSVNDKKRDILLMRPEFLLTLNSRIQSLFVRLNKSSNILDIPDSLLIGDLSE